MGIGGSWSEFLDYTVASLKSDHVKLLLGENSVSNGIISDFLIVVLSMIFVFTCLSFVFNILRSSFRSLFLVYS